MQVEGFDWDEGNSEKCRKHGVSLAEIEEIFTNSPIIAPDIRHSQDELRYLAIGASPGGRMVFLAYTMRDGLIRPISARYMHEKEIRAYEKANSSS